MADVTLEDFVAETLRAISVGVHRAREATKEAGSPPIAPFSVNDETTTDGQQLVRFEVSVEASAQKASDVGGEATGTVISVVAGAVHGERYSAQTDRRSHTVEFSVPVHFNAGWAQPKED